MEFLVETLKNASLHIHAVWLAIAYIAVIVTQAMEMMAKVAWGGGSRGMGGFAGAARLAGGSPVD